MREYDANLVELWEVVPYGVGVGGNDANDVTNGKDNEHNEHDKDTTT